MKACLLYLVLIGFARSLNYEAEWKSFKALHARSFEDDREELLRKQIFMDNKKLIDAHNLRYEAGAETFQMGVNQFTDMLQQEFVALTMGSRNATDFNADHIYVPPANLKLPETVDWRIKGAVSGVRQQAACGCCWAFAAVGTLEGQHFLKTKKMLEFSEQNLLDCSSIAPYKNAGCKEGTPHEALRYVQENHGVNTLRSYPYEGRVGACRFRREHIGVTVKASVTVQHGDEAALQAAVADKGPIAVIIDAQHLQPYKSGIYNQACSGKASYHAVLLVGYGKERGVDYWLLKNSWGNWGEGGFFRMARNNHNLCSIASWPVYPLI